MLYAKWIHGSDDISLAKAVREQVFVNEQSFAPEQEFDTFDNGAWHVVAMEDETPIGTGRLYIDDGKFTIGRLCVLPEYRNMGIGDALMRLLMDRGLEVGAPALYISAQEPLCGMYEKYGFAQIGEPYQEGSIPHVTMTVKAEEVQFPGGCGGSCGGGCSGCAGCGG